jgi:uncharacterized protein YuzE
MEITYSAGADALAIVLVPDAASARTVQQSGGVALDFDARGRLIALEVLDASTRYDPAWLASLGSPVRTLTLAEAAEESGLAPATLRVQLSRGRLAGEKRGRDWFVAEHELFDYLESRAPQGRPAAKKKARRPKARV